MHSRLLPNCRMCTAVQFEADGQKRLIHCRPICVQTLQTSRCHVASIRLRRNKQKLNCKPIQHTRIADTTHSTFVCIKLVSGIAVLPMFALASRIGHRSCQWFCNKSITFTPTDWLQILHERIQFFFLCRILMFSQNYSTQLEDVKC